MIKVRDVWFSYNGGTDVLRGVDIDLNDGDLLGILGPNGSGKTTLLRLLSGVVRPKKGSISIDGMELSKKRRVDIARTIAVVPQENDLGFDYTVEEVVSMGRYPHMGRFQLVDRRGPEIMERAMEITGVLDLGRKQISSLSGGEKQRTMIARALAQEPKILLLDEPTKNLDVRHSLDILELVREWNRKQGLTVALVLHDLDLAARYCSSVVLLREGRVEGKGRSHDILTPTMIERVFDVKADVIKDRDRLRVEILG